MKTSRLLFGALIIGHSSLSVPQTALAADDALRPVAFQNGVNQQALGAETAELAREIDSLIEELQRNGFPVQSLSALTELAAQLNALGGTEMTAIAQRLRKLGESAQADPRATATEAYLAQQAIESRLKTLARQISIQQLREETARRLEALITRQLGIQRETKAIASAKSDNERQRLLESDQSGIGEDLATFFQTGENLLARLREQKTLAGGSPAAPEPTFAERINGALLTTLSTEAHGELKGKRYPTAYARQDALVAELRKILQGILSSLPKDQRLANALQQVSALRQQEEAKQQAKTPAEKENAQAAADQAQNLANQVAPLSAEAAEALREAQKALQNEANGTQPPSAAQANQQPNKPAPDQTPPPPANAAQALAAAEAALQQSLAQAQAQNKPNQGQPQQPGQPQGQQQARNGQQQGQQQGGPQPPSGQNQRQGQQNQTAQNGRQQNGQLRADGQPPDDRHLSGYGDAQSQIAGHGPDAKDPAQAVGALRPEEREAFSALQGERYPAEYAAWVRQYWRNLAQDQ